MINYAIATPDNPPENPPANPPEPLKCYEYVVSQRNNGSKSQESDVVRYILATKTEADQHPKWQPSENEQCKTAMHL